MAVEQPKKVAGGAFGQYLTENRAALFKELAGQPATATVKLASERFKALDDDAKAKYQKMYEAAKQKYEEDLAAFLSAGGQMKARKCKKGGLFAKKPKDPNKPKQPAGGAFGCFLAAKRAEFTKELGPGKAVTAVTKHASERWKEISEAEKGSFQKEFEEKMAQYKKAMETYMAPVVEEDDEEDEGDQKDQDEEAKDKKVKKPKDPNKLEQPSGGGFGCFLAKRKAEFTNELGLGGAVTAVTDLASERWNEISEAEKCAFQEEFDEKMTQYKKTIRTYQTPEKKKKTYIVERLPSNTSQPMTKRRRTLTTLDVEPSALAEAQQLGLESQFMEFACSPEVFENGVMLKRGAGARVLFRILKGVNGDVEQAKKKFEKKIQASQRIPN